MICRDNVNLFLLRRIVGLTMARGERELSFVLQKFIYCLETFSGTTIEIWLANDIIKQ